MSKPKLNHGFSSVDFVTTVTSLVTMALITTPIIFRKMASANIELAQRETTRLAEEFDAKLKSRGSGGARGVASAEDKSSVSQDPWGNPYVVKTINNSYGQAAFLVVVSKGPNAQLDTDDSKLQLIRSNIFVFNGDDVGFIRPIE